MLDAASRYFPAETVATHPSGGYFLWFESPFPERVDLLQLFRQARERGISVALGPNFSATQGFRHCLRLSYGHPWTPRSEAAMATLGELINAF